MDKYCLIAEIRKRRALWDYKCEERSRIKINDLWREVAKSVGAPIDDCRIKWRNLRDAYRTERNRGYARKERAIRKGTYDCKKEYGSKWEFFQHMKFVESGIKKRPSVNNKLINESGTNLQNNKNPNQECQIKNINVSSPPPLRLLTNVGENTLVSLKKQTPQTYYQIRFLDNSDREEEITDCPTQDKSPNANECELQSGDNISIKMDLDIEQQKDFDNDNTMNSEKQNENPTSTVMQENSIANRSPAGDTSDHERSTDDMSVASENEESKDFNRKVYLVKSDPESNFLVSFTSHMKSMTQLQNLQFRAKFSELILNILADSTVKESELKKYENIKTNLKAWFDINDPDCNFLISYLPHLKSMSQLENLKFRTKMPELILNILTTTSSKNHILPD